MSEKYEVLHGAAKEEDAYEANIRRREALGHAMRFWEGQSTNPDVVVATAVKFEHFLGGVPQ